jgi:nucleoid DNA-binding protein
MTKNELTKEMAENLGINQQEATKIITAFIKTLVDGLDRGETIYLRGLGTFSKRVVTKRCNVDINSGEPKGKEFTYPRIRFKMGVSLKKKLSV